MTQLEKDNILRYAYQSYLYLLKSQQNALSYSDWVAKNKDSTLQKYIADTML